MNFTNFFRSLISWKITFPVCYFTWKCLKSRTMVNSGTLKNAPVLKRNIKSIAQTFLLLFLNREKVVNCSKNRPVVHINNVLEAIRGKWKKTFLSAKLDWFLQPTSSKIVFWNYYKLFGFCYTYRLRYPVDWITKLPKAGLTLFCQTCFPVFYLGLLYG